MRSTPTLRIASIALAFAIAPVAHAATYTPVDLFTLQPPAGITYPSVSTLNAISNNQVVGMGTNAATYLDALLWTSNGTPVDLMPTSGYIQTIANGIGGNLQVGYGSGPATGANPNASSGYNINALTWSGSANSLVDIHPNNLPAIIQSGASGTDGTHIVGYGMLANNVDHALLWTGTNTAVDLNPATAVSSIAYATDGTHTVGRMGNTINHAALWTGTSNVAVDLHPKQILLFKDINSSSAALAISGNQQAGFGLGSVNGNPSSHALIWSGTAASAVDLHPGGIYPSSTALATNGSQQAGWASYPVNSTYLPHAMMWSGTAASAIDLHALLPAGFIDSTAFAINPAGDVSGTADDSNGTHEILWIAPPHAATASVSAGSNVNAAAAGRSPLAGDVHVTFPTAAAGTFTNTNALQTLQALSAATAPPPFALPAGSSNLVQTWDLSYTGAFTGPATLTFHFDPSSFPAGFDESTLRIEHFVNGQWTTLPGTVDTTQNLITVTTPSFSPFALAAVPEPSTALLLLAFPAILKLRRRLAPLD